jgi:predicted nucleotidyltransferase
MKSSSLDIIKLAKGLKRSFPEILFAFLFGSARDGKVKKGSDIDIAVYLKNEMRAKSDGTTTQRHIFRSAYPLNDRMRGSSDITALISRIMKFIETETSNECDLKILNDADPLLAMEALQGTILFIRKEAMDTYADFYSLICRLYEDQIFWMKKQLEYRGYEVQWDN